MTEQNIAAATIAWSIFSQTTESEEFCSFYTGVAMVAVKTFWWSNNRPLGTKGLKLIKSWENASDGAIPKTFANMKRSLKAVLG